MLAWLVVRWGWEIARPVNVPASAPRTPVIEPAAAAQQVSQAALFGRAGETASRQEAQVSALNLKLKGVFAARGQVPAYAILNTGQPKDDVFRVGDEVLPGVRLNSVEPEFVVVQRAGVRERVNLEERPGGVGRIRPTVLPSPAAAVPSFRTNPAQTSPGSFNVSRGELGAALADPRQLANLGRVSPNPAGGVQVEDVPPGSLAERLGLQPGDVVRNINGTPVNSPADITRLYGQLGQAGQVRVDGLRGNRPLNLTYNIQQ